MDSNDPDQDLLVALVLGPPADVIGTLASEKERERQEKAERAIEARAEAKQSDRRDRRLLAFLAPLIVVISILAVVLLPDAQAIQNGNFFLFGEGVAVDLTTWAADHLSLAWYVAGGGGIACLIWLAIGPRFEALFILTALALAGAAVAAAAPVVAVLGLMLANLVVYVGTAILVIAIIFGMLIAYGSSR